MTERSGQNYVESEFRRSLQMIAMSPKTRTAYFPEEANVASEVVLDFVGCSEAYLELNRSMITPEFLRECRTLREILMLIYDSGYADSEDNDSNWEKAGSYARRLLDA